jgi:hypothetical protein
MYVKIGRLGTLNNLEQRSTVLYLARKGLHPRAIHRDIVVTLGPEAASYSSVTRSLRDPVLSSSTRCPLCLSRNVSSTLIKLSSLRPLSNPSHRFGSRHDSPSSQERLCAGDSPNLWDFVFGIFDGCPIVCHTLKT